MFTRPGIPLHIPLPSGYLLHSRNGFSHGTVMDFTVISPKMERKNNLVMTFTVCHGKIMLLIGKPSISMDDLYHGEL